ncbi:AbrB/MazE/SpoVT family DNA-binding domain-containing protein [Peribacillus sp. NJ4]|uniref:AbrB/MazE/SpoVT family DNA-binding domain-containing protein n=1 Tax=Peribacillus TaxID=2675229 RepID=UPI00259FFE4F|nr:MULTISPECIES: AbrB/MazE/SpoVT family DNA-binding domain-containing protein [unclassified Peribacillus]MDM5215091.1 AbrB/MazE/SpoVT family DNA-binding domain-containing protein [Peribacillus sp. NJ4]MDM5224378.1 AbrB/MazE/SpoVT family DNA-binding domain-containing protein [Peribacillus sp. NJ11]
MAIRKLTKVGNSLGITFPMEMLKTANLAFGDELEVEFKGEEIILRKNKNVKLPKGVDAEFMEMLSDVIKEHDEAFKGLVDR